MDLELARRFELAQSIAREAGRSTLRLYQSADLAVDFKADRSPVTEADRQAEELLRTRIAAAFPQDAILGEELPEVDGTSGYRWILDPIDGTQSFIRGVPLYGTMVGVEREQQSVIGVVYMPALDECIFAAVGQGSWLQRGTSPARRARVSNVDTLADALLSSSDTRFSPAKRAAAYAQLQSSVRVSRTWGDCYGYLLVATGRADIMLDPIMNVWDAAAVQPIVLEAGGSFTDWQGQPTIYSGDSIATNGKLAAAVLAITRGC